MYVHNVSIRGLVFAKSHRSYETLFCNTAAEQLLRFHVVLHHLFVVSQRITTNFPLIFVCFISEARGMECVVANGNLVCCFCATAFQPQRSAPALPSSAPEISGAPTFMWTDPVVKIPIVCVLPETSHRYSALSAYGGVWQIMAVCRGPTLPARGYQTPT